MIHEGKHLKALKASHYVLIKARSMAYNEENNKKDIADLLDIAEYLIVLIMEDKDSTAMFRDQLELIAKRFSYSVPLQYFDDAWRE